MGQMAIMKGLSIFMAMAGFTDLSNMAAKNYPMSNARFMAMGAVMHSAP